MVKISMFSKRFSESNQCVLLRTSADTSDFGHPDQNYENYIFSWLRISQLK